MYQIISNGECSIICILGSCLSWTNQIDKQWVPFNPGKEHPRYACIYSHVFVPIFGSFYDWVIAIFENSSASEYLFDYIHKVILYGILSQMWYIVTCGDFGVVSNDDPKEYGCSIGNFTSGPYTLE